MDQIHLEQAGNPGAFLPPPDPGDNRVLARPVLFVHGIQSNATAWGVRFANRTCNQTFRSLDGWVVSNEGSHSSYYPSGMAQKDNATVHLDISMNCEATTKIEPGHAEISLWPVTRTWVPTQPWMGFFDRDNPPRYQYRIKPSGTWTDFGGSIPDLTQVIQFRALVPKPGGLSQISGSWPISTPPTASMSAASDLTDQTNAWWVAMQSILPSLANVFQVSGGVMTAKVVQFDTVDLLVQNVAVTGGQDLDSLGYNWSWSWTEDVTPWDFFRNSRNKYTLPEAHPRVLMRDYKFSTAPDILARIERLDRRYDSTNADAGINRNGIYFYTALDDQGQNLSELQPPMWDPATYGYSATRGQARQLWERMDTVLSHHYGSREAWIHDSTRKIDIVCHSQGCLITREALRVATDASLANPLNHIRKVVSLNSPAFGSALATQASDLSADFSSMGQIRHLLLDTNGQLIPNKDVELGFARLAAPLAGGVGGAVYGYQTCSDAVGVPVLAQIAGVDCALGGAVLGAVAAPFTNYTWALNGGLLGPYDLRVRTNTAGFTTINHLNLPSPTSARAQMVSFSDTTRHLSQTSLWIDALRRSGYPTQPLDRSPVPFSVRYSPSTGHLVDTLGNKLSQMAQKYCSEHDDWYSANCDYVQILMESVLGTHSISSDPTVNQLLQWTHDFQTQWTDQGDVVVEKGSQLMVNAAFGFTPRTGVFDTAGYHYQTAYGVGGGKFVAHTPIVVDASLDVNGSSLQLALARAGASLLGLDIHAALGYDTLAFTQGIQRLPKARHTVLVGPTHDVLHTPNSLAEVQQLPVTGDFDVAVISGDSIIQGVAVGADSVQPDLVAIWNRSQGVLLRVYRKDGTQTTRIVTNGGRPVQVRLTRTGDVFRLIATGLDGLVNSDTVQLSLPSQVWVGALSTPEVAQSDALRPALVGTLHVTDTSALLAEQPWNLVVLARESSNSSTLSQPAIVLVNKDTRTLNGVTLYYEFRADPSRVPVLQSFQGPGNATLESMGGDRWRVRIAVSGATVPPGVLYPSADGFRFQLNYQDGSDWPRKAQWSSYGGSPVLRWSDRIQVRDNVDHVLVGREIPGTDAGARSAVVGLARDGSMGSSNLSSPVLSVRNEGGTALLKFRATWYVRAPVGKTLSLESWFVPDAQPSLKALGNGLWQIDMVFPNHILYPGQSTPEQKIGIHFPDWSAWDRSGNPSQSMVSQGLAPVAGMVVRDSTGRILWGNLPNLDDTAAQTVVVPPSGGAVLPVTVQIRDENPSDNTWIRPRMILTNQGSAALSAFTVSYPLLVDTTKALQVAPWYAPGCQVGLVRAAGVAVDTVRYTCQNLNVAPGGIWPDLGGAVVGIQYVDGTLWSRWSDPFVSSWTISFAPTTQVVVRSVP